MYHICPVFYNYSKENIYNRDFDEEQVALANAQRGLYFYRKLCGYGVKLVSPLVRSLHLHEPDESVVCILKHTLSKGRSPLELNTALNFAVRRSSVVVARKLVLCGADINYQDENGWTPLHYAIDSGNLESVCMLLYYNVDVSIDCQKLSPLSRAIFYMKLDIVEVLLDYCFVNPHDVQLLLTLMTLNYPKPFMYGYKNYIKLPNKMKGNSNLAFNCIPTSPIYDDADDLIYIGEIYKSDRWKEYILPYIMFSKITLSNELLLDFLSKFCSQLDVLRAIRFFIIPHSVVSKVPDRKISRNILSILKLKQQSAVPSLLQLSRDQIRKSLICSYRYTTPHEFLQAVKMLKIPSILHDVIVLKREIYPTVEF